jgi:hypothetical protein
VEKKNVLDIIGCDLCFAGPGQKSLARRMCCTLLTHSQRRCQVRKKDVTWNITCETRSGGKMRGEYKKKKLKKYRNDNILELDDVCVG